MEVFSFFLPMPPVKLFIIKKERFVNSRKEPEIKLLFFGGILFMSKRTIPLLYTTDCAGSKSSKGRTNSRSYVRQCVAAPRRAGFFQRDGGDNSDISDIGSSHPRC